MAVSFVEMPVVFGDESECMVGIAVQPATPAATGVMILVGGRQYRGGSHRQFVCLARRLADAGYCVFRFDFRGMGDSSGRQRSFEEVDADIAAAIAAFQATCPAVRQVVLWGLCDAATAAVLYWQRCRDARIVGMCLANPWLRSEAGLARTRVRHYYRQRIFDPEFWRKFLRGRVGPIQSLREYFATRRLARNSALRGYQRVMLDGMNAFPGPLLLLLSERDLTAREFLDRLLEDSMAPPLLHQSRVRRIDIADADHTFSRECWKNAAEDAVVAWLADQWRDAEPS